MEALTACAVAALTVYDMVKGIERGVTIEEVALLEKTGGKEDWSASDVTCGRGCAPRSSPSAPPEATGSGADESGPALAEFARELGAEIAATEIVPDEREQIEWALRHCADSERCDLVLTTGGTGFAPDDVTPEATRAVIEREAPGIAEAMRAASRASTRRNWMLSRAVAGIRGPHADRQLPRQPEEHPPGRRGDRAGAPARARAARRGSRAGTADGQLRRRPRRPARTRRAPRTRGRRRSRLERARAPLRRARGAART